MRPANQFVRFVILVLALVSHGALMLPISAKAQMGFDRPGGDYTHLQIPSRDPTDCAMACERDRRCKSWSFGFPPDFQGAAGCWLKSSLPPRIADNCCISGVRGAGVIEPRGGRFEIFVDRFGGDYRSFKVEGGNGDDACQQACKGDTKCRAWTFAREGYAGREARCFLKGEIKPPRRAPGLVSGVVR